VAFVAAAAASRRRRAGQLARASRRADTAAAMLLGLMAWVWVGLPLIQGGPTQVRAVLKAKLTNKDKDGAPLP